ncbi:MAG TPA: carboxypeptidase-like regulatory domain-containing protein, partial [Prolixibacteraceae bacterium]|nr:carboxypeptidase-like regulatory domain-containing protein [Prolixibacteraceae bacterium]
NADIFIEDEETGTITNSNGEYVLYLSKGEYDVVFSLKGYEKHTEKIVLEECMIQLVELNHKNNIGSRKSILAGWSVFNKNNTEKLTMADEK